MGAGSEASRGLHTVRCAQSLACAWRSVAFKRAKENDGRASVSAVLTEMVEANRKALEKEGRPFL